jgi:thiol-disulfide isomerase/thioredoxin
MRRLTCTLVFLLLASRLLSQTNEEAATTLTRVGQESPVFEFTTLDGKQSDLKSLRGKVVLLNFFATWCGPCMAAIPHNNELLKNYKDKGLLIVGVCTHNRGQEKMAQTVKDKGIQYPTARDPQLKSQKAWAVQYYPTYAIIDRKGIVRIIGLQPNNVEKVVKKLLDEPPA